MVDFHSLGWCALPVIVWVAIMIVERWWLRWLVTRLTARIRWNEEHGIDDGPLLYPESLYIVRCSEAAVSCTQPDGTTESVAWDDLQRIEIVTTDQGPFLPDVFWVLHGSEVGCVVPQGATGERDMLGRLQRLPGFRNEAVIEASPSTDNRRFLCWEKP